MWTQFRNMPRWGQAILAGLTMLLPLGVIGAILGIGSEVDKVMEDKPDAPRTASSSASIKQSWCSRQLSITRPKRKRLKGYVGHTALVHSGRVRVRGRTAAGAEVTFGSVVEGEDHVQRPSSTTALRNGAFDKTLELERGLNIVYVAVRMPGCSPVKITDDSGNHLGRQLKAVAVVHRPTRAKRAVIRERETASRRQRVSRPSSAPSRTAPAPSPPSPPVEQLSRPEPSDSGGLPPGGEDFDDSG